MMKKIIVLLIILVPAITFTQAYPHDSLLFDGAGNYDTYLKNSEFKCRIVAVSAKNAIGDIWDEKKGEICGQEATFVETKDSVVLKDSDKLQENSWVTTGEGGYADILIMAGEGNVTFTKLSLGPNSQMKLPSLKEICEALKNKKPGPVADTKLKKGKLYVEIIKDAEKLIKDISKVAYESQRYNPVVFWAINTVARHLFTKFTIEIAETETETTDIIKVYEGKVEVSLQGTGEVPGSDEAAKRMEQLAKDMQEGKITPEEFQAKIAEYTEEMKKKSADMQPVVVDEGSKCTSTKYSLKVEPIESNDDRWWEK